MLLLEAARRAPRRRADRSADGLGARQSRSEDEAVEHYEAAIAGDLSEEELRGALLGLEHLPRARPRRRLRAHAPQGARALPGLPRVPRVRRADRLQPRSHSRRCFGARGAVARGEPRSVDPALSRASARTPTISIAAGSRRFRRRSPRQRDVRARGLVPDGDGWFVLNARDAAWRHGDADAVCDFEGKPGFPQLGLNLSVLLPGETMAMYHWEADQEDFLVLAGDAIPVVEVEERPLRRGLAHRPAGASMRSSAPERAVRARAGRGARRSTGAERRLHRRRDGGPRRRQRRAGHDEAGRGAHPTYRVEGRRPYRDGRRPE